MEKFAAAFKKVQKINKAIIGAVLLLMIGVVFLQTFCRFVIFKSLTWSEELSSYLFVALIVLGINLAATDHLFVRIELIDGYLKGKAQYVMDVIRKGIAIYVSLILMYSGYGLIEIGGYQISPAMGISMSLLYGIMCIGFIMNFLALIVDTWEEFGKEKAGKIAASFLEDKPTWVRCNLHRADRERILASLKAQGTLVRELPFMESMIAIDGYDYLEGRDAFRKGWIQVQDVTSAFVGEIASPEKDSYIIDVCAAPGGKSLHLADKLEGTGMVEARDLTYQKTALIEENMARCGVTNMKTLVWDALETDPSAMAKADIVIADLPCSGLGIIGRKPDIKYNMTPEKLEELAGLQREILSVVWQYVKPGGLLCYSTCTIDRLENQDNAAWLRERFPLVPVDLTDRFGGLPQEPSLKDGWIQFLPGVHPYDGFFISVFRRAEGETGPEGI